MRARHVDKLTDAVDLFCALVRRAGVGGFIDAWPRIICLTLVLPLVAGCFVPSVRQPDRLYTIDQEIQQIRTALNARPDIWACFNAADQRSCRNAYITLRMYAIDVLYTKYEASLTHEKQDIDFGATAVSLGLTSTASLIPVAQTSRILSGIATGVTGLNTAYNEKVLLSHAIQNLQTQMRTDRARQAAGIIAKMESPIEKYTFGMALSDLEEYYAAGTITSGLIGLSTTVNKAAVEAGVGKDRVGPNAAKVLPAKNGPPP